MTPPRVKICCIASREEAHMAIQAGASALGLVARMPSGPGPIPDELIADIAGSVPPPVATFLLTSETDAQAIIRHHLRVHTNTIQIVDRLENGTYQEIRLALPNVKLVQVIHVIDESAIDEALEAEPHIDAILLDSGNPNLQVKVLGGTGAVHNWEISRKIREQLHKPIFLAGGLHADNVKKAVETVNPFGIDLCSGVRTEGRLDPIKLDLFFKALPG